MIRRGMLVEDLVDALPGSIPYLLDRGIQVIACGAPVWGTLEEAARREGHTDDQIDGIVADLLDLERRQRSS